MEQSREQSLKYVQGGLYFPELPQTHHGQHWNDMELDRTDGQVKLSILLTACSSKMCTEMEGLMMVAVSDTLTENWGVCWKLYFSSVKIPSGFWPSLNCCQRSVIQACSVPCLAFLSGCKHTCKVGNDKAWPTAVPRFLPPGSTRACLSIRNKHPVWKLIRLAGWVFSLLSAWYPCWCFLIPSPVPQECYCCELRFCMCFQEYALETEGSSVTLHVLVETGVLLARRLRSAAVWGRGVSSWSNTNCIWSLSAN